MMRTLLARVACALSVAWGAGWAGGGEAARPNVVLIVCDDLNDWIEPLGGHPQARTPALARFAETGVTFTNAHSNNPVCAPSRASFLTGIYPHRSGNLFWKKWFENPVLSNSKTLMRHFGDNGYRVVGSGKLMHHARRDEWDEFPHGQNYGPFAWDGSERVGHPSVNEPFRSIGAIDGSFGSLADVPFADRPEMAGAGWLDGRWGRARPFRYVSEDDRDLLPDETVARWAVRRLEAFASAGEGPFFMGVGFIRPHTPMYAPQRYFDGFPVEEIVLPRRLEGDGGDAHYGEHVLPDQKGRRYFRLISEAYGSPEAGLRRFAQAYLASTAFVDDQIGAVLDAIDRTGLAESTVVLITSDHGFGIGDKDYLFKNSPWETSTRVPLLIRAPGVSVAGARVGVPVSLIDVYPTLADLAGLVGDTRATDAGMPLDGHSLRPLIADPAAGRWGGPPAALTMVHAEEEAIRALSPVEADDPAFQHWSIRTEAFRYVRYNSGAIELYNHRVDPNEWRNVADDPSRSADVARLDGLLRSMIAPVVLEPIASVGPRP